MPGEYSNSFRPSKVACWPPTTTAAFGRFALSRRMSSRVFIQFQLYSENPMISGFSLRIIRACSSRIVVRKYSATRHKRSKGFAQPSANCGMYMLRLYLRKNSRAKLCLSRLL